MKGQQRQLKLVWGYQQAHIMLTAEVNQMLDVIRPGAGRDHEAAVRLLQGGRIGAAIGSKDQPAPVECHLKALQQTSPPIGACYQHVRHRYSLTSQDGDRRLCSRSNSLG